MVFVVVACRVNVVAFVWFVIMCVVFVGGVCCVLFVANGVLFDACRCVGKCKLRALRIAVCRCVLSVGMRRCCRL